MEPRVDTHPITLREAKSDRIAFCATEKIIASWTAMNLARILLRESLCSTALSKDITPHIASRRLIALMTWNQVPGLEGPVCKSDKELYKV